MGDDFSSYSRNTLTGKGGKGVAAGGISYAYVKEVSDNAACKLLKISTPNPFPEKVQKYLIWIKIKLEFVEKRNKRIQEFINNHTNH